MNSDEADLTVPTRIKEAAKQLFLCKGYDGTKMQAIADASGVNKALLHYYFLSKDKLFLLVFQEELSELSESLASIWAEGGASLCERLEDWVDSQLSFLERSPQLPLFIITEMTRNPELIKGLLSEFLPPQHLLQATPQEAGPEGRATLPAFVEIVGLVFSLVYFPALAAPMIRQLLGVGTPLIDELTASQARLAKALVRQKLGAEPQA